MMIDFLECRNRNESRLDVDIFATGYFHRIWEAACGKAMGNQYDILHGLVPQPEWESDIIAGRIAQRPDILFCNEDILYILDAKYYTYQQSAPGWHDIVKQLFYLLSIDERLKLDESLKRKFNIRKIVNVFIFPGENVGDIRYIGKCKVKDIELFREIYAFAINSENIMTQQK